MLDLEACADVWVGDTSIKGISGGQQRRVGIGIELITRPGILFLDEPTSGLDSTTALALCISLKEIATKWLALDLLHENRTKNPESLCGRGRVSDIHLF